VEVGVTPVSVWLPGSNRPCEFGAKYGRSAKDGDWRWRMQALADVAAGKLKVDASAVAPLTRDPHVLVRRHAMFALGSSRRCLCSVVGSRTYDEESSVRIGAALPWVKSMVRKVRSESLRRCERQQVSNEIGVCGALAAMKERRFPRCSRALRALCQKCVMFVSGSCC